MDTNSLVILPQKYSALVLLSCQQGLWYVYKYYQIKHYNMMLSSLILYFTSIVFWINPTYGVRRNVDRLVVHITSLFTFYNAYECNKFDMFVYFNALCFSGFCIYLVGCRLYDANYLFWYTICHIALHTFGGLGNAVLVECVQHETVKEKIDDLKMYITGFHCIFFMNYVCWFCIKKQIKHISTLFIEYSI
jgi:hypothetical protein